MLQHHYVLAAGQQGDHRSRGCSAARRRRLIKAPKKLGKLDGQIVHINDNKEWELGKLHKIKTKEVPAPTGGMTKVRHHYKSKNATHGQFFRLRLRK